jgi:hypothetical protein
MMAVTHYPDMPTFASFSMLQGHRIGLEDISEILNGGPHLDDHVQMIQLLDTELEDVPVHLDEYMRSMADTFHERETSPFLRETLAIASKLAVEKQVPPQRYLRISLTKSGFSIRKSSRTVVCKPCPCRYRYEMDDLRDFPNSCRHHPASSLRLGAQFLFVSIDMLPAPRIDRKTRSTNLKDGHE